MNHVTEEFSRIGIIPVIALWHTDDAEPLAKALLLGGLPCAEITFRTDAAEESIRIMADRFPEMLVGAGTVLTTAQVDQAMAAGAKFIVSPGFNPKIVSYCIDRSIPIIPGCSSPSDIEAAIEAGLEVVKFFPAEASGGLAAIQAMAAPYSQIRFMPTGGIHAGNFKNYLDFSKVIACGGTWMLGSYLQKRNWNGITQMVKESISDMLGLSIQHIALYQKERTKESASVLPEKLLTWTDKEQRGTCGDIAIGTNYVERAQYHLEKCGAKFEETSKEFREDGSVKSVYLQQEIGGFAVHLQQKQEES